MKNKLLNFTICQIFLVIGLVSILRVSCQEQKRNVTVENVTIFDRSFEKVLSRRKRFLVWRPGSNLLVGFNFQISIRLCNLKILFLSLQHQWLKLSFLQDLAVII